MKSPNYGQVLAEIGSNPHSYGVKTFHQQSTTRNNTTFHDIAHGSYMGIRQVSPAEDVDTCSGHATWYYTQSLEMNLTCWPESAASRASRHASVTINVSFGPSNAFPRPVTCSTKSLKICRLQDVGNVCSPSVSLLIRYTFPPRTSITPSVPATRIRSSPWLGAVSGRR